MEKQGQTQLISGFSDFEEQQKKNPFGIHVSPIRILSNLLRFWYVILASILIALGIAWAINRYTIKVYTMRAEIMIRETNEATGVELLYNNPLVNPYRNYYNEEYKIKSYPVIEKVVQNLGLNTTFINEGKIKDSEVYKSLPVDINILSPDYTNCNFLFTLITKDSYSLSPVNENLEILNAKQVYHFNDTINCSKLLFVVKKQDGRIKNHIGKEYLLKIEQVHNVASRYIAGLSIKWRAQGSSLLDLGINGKTPEKGIDFLNELIRVYKEEDERSKKETGRRSIEFIRTQMNEIADSLNLVELQLENFKDKNYVIDMNAESQRLFDVLEESQKERSEILYKQHYYKYLDKYVTENQNLDQIILPDALGIKEGVMSELVSKMVELQLKAKSVNRNLKSESPYVGILEDQINDLRQNILESLKGLKQADRFTLDQLEAEMRNISTKLKMLPGAERELVSIQRNYNLLEGVYVFLLQKLAEARISQEGIISDVIPVNPARTTGPIQPQPMQNYSVALFLGLLIPASFFALKEFFNSKVQSKDDITAVTDIPFLGAVGHNIIDSNLIVYTKPRSSMAEGFRSLRSNLHYFVHKEGAKTYLVTSSVSSEGKTFTSINLGTVFAISGKKTLLIGADLRKPKIYDDFNLTNEIGLSNYLSHQVNFEDIVQDTFIDNLSIVSAGPVPPNPSELMLGERLDEFFKESKAKFDILIIDTPPLDILTDAFTLTQYADHNLFIVRQGFTPLSTVQKLKEITHKMKSISIVLNDIRNTRPGYGLGYGYSYGYGYGKYGYGRKKDSYGYGSYYTDES